MTATAPLATAARHRAALRDGPSAVVGAALAAVIHLAIVLFALRAGAREGNIARADERARAAPREENLIEGALLRQGGGGEFDPRRMVHRVAPVRAEERASVEQGLSKNHNPVPANAEHRARRDPDSLITDRDILGQGNQDLAERRRLEQLAAMEADPAAPPGAGAPDGSVHGTETDPNRAGHGAQAKLRSFLDHAIHLPETTPAEVRARGFRFSITLSDDGASIARGSVTRGSGDDGLDSDVALALAQLSENHTPIPELSDEEKAALAGRRFTVRYP